MDPLSEYCREAIMDDDGNELVVEYCKCPKCGERRMDYLATDDGIVTCQSCGTVYDLEPEREEAPNA
jgi:rubredoxin